MKASPAATPAETALSEVAVVGLANIEWKTIETVALDVWYAHAVPDLTQLEGQYRHEALFLLERLTYYNVVPQVKKKALLLQVRQAGGVFESMQNAELESRFNTFLPMLQPLQTRHYKPSSTGT